MCEGTISWTDKLLEKESRLQLTILNLSPFKMGEDMGLKIIALRST
jgi:hypothetical protein